MGDSTRKYRHLFTIAAMVIILLGIILRLKVLLDNRCLWIDEASVARNIFERNLAGLVKPLDYYQYAPPLYLWIVKFFASIFNYSEAVLRLWSFLTGAGCLVLLWRILKREAGGGTALYPLFLAATGFYFVRYGTELKQYIPDMFICSLLVWQALRVDIRTTSTKRFVFIWAVVGSLAIWASMPSVFALAGVGLYYSFMGREDRIKLLTIVAIAATWCLQFLSYYFVVLKPQIQSEYLQTYHQRFFLFATPASLVEWTHNKDVLLAILKMAGGEKWYGLGFNLSLLISGVVFLLRSSFSKSMLLIMPVFLLLAAAAINQYSLIPRLTLFATPLLYIIMAYGLWQIVQIKMLKFIVVPVAIICGLSHQRLALFSEPFEQEEITHGLAYLKQKKVSAKDLYIIVGAEHAYLYYTEMHPQRYKWKSLRQAHLLPGNVDYDSLGAALQGRPAFLYTIVFDSFEGKKKLEHHVQLNDSFATEGCYVFIYHKKATP